jgi:hypothetical protein
MMHKTSLIFLGAIAGAGLTLLATQPHTAFVELSAEAASSDTYRLAAIASARASRASGCIQGYTGLLELC